MLKYIHIFNIILEGPVVGHLENAPNIERRMSVAYIRLPLNDGMTERRKLRAFSALNLTLYIINFFLSKEQCHEDFAVLGQFCAKISTLRLKL